MFGRTKEIYFATRKKNDQLFNMYFMRPCAAFVVSILEPTRVTPNQLTLLNLIIFVIGAAVMMAIPTYTGGVIAVLIIEFSYLFDCADGMLARAKKIASKSGHLFDFFTDELKALLLVTSIGLHLARAGGYGIDLSPWPTDWFLVSTIAGGVVIASATSLTNFVRRPELTGQETPVEAHYETVEQKRPSSLSGWLKESVVTFLRFLNHYPSHLYLFALLGRLDAFFWTYIAINTLYLGRGWLGLVIRFGRP